MESAPFHLSPRDGKPPGPENAGKGRNGRTRTMRIALDERGPNLGSNHFGFRLLDRAFEALRAFDPELGRLAEFRVFGGLSAEAAGRLLELSPRAAKRNWSQAKAFLLAFLEEDGKLEDPEPEN